MLERRRSTLLRRIMSGHVHRLNSARNMKPYTKKCAESLIMRPVTRLLSENLCRGSVLWRSN
eukprot:4150548-Amphidinium_carterae.1